MAPSSRDGTMRRITLTVEIEGCAVCCCVSVVVAMSMTPSLLLWSRHRLAIAVYYVPYGLEYNWAQTICHRWSRGSCPPPDGGYTMCGGCTNGCFYRMVCWRIQKNQLVGL